MGVPFRSSKNAVMLVSIYSRHEDGRKNSEHAEMWATLQN